MLQEVKEARQRYETSLVEVDSGRKEEYESKLSLALADMRVQNEEQMKIYKDSMESTYAAKVWIHCTDTRHTLDLFIFQLFKKIFISNRDVMKDYFNNRFFAELDEKKYSLIRLLKMSTLFQIDNAEIALI